MGPWLSVCSRTTRYVFGIAAGVRGCPVCPRSKWWCDSKRRGQEHRQGKSYRLQMRTQQIRWSLLVVGEPLHQKSSKGKETKLRTLLPPINIERSPDYVDGGKAEIFYVCSLRTSCPDSLVSALGITETSVRLSNPGRRQ